MIPTSNTFAKILAAIMTASIFFSGTGKRPVSYSPICPAEDVYKSGYPHSENLQKLRDTAFYKSGQVMTKLYRK